MPDLIAAAAAGQYRAFMFVVDGVTIRDADHPVLVIDLADQPGRTFRVIPSEMWSVKNNLSLANMDFDEFAGATDASGIFSRIPVRSLTIAPYRTRPWMNVIRAGTAEIRRGGHH